VTEESSETIEQTQQKMFAAHLKKMRVQKELADFDRRIARRKQRTLSDWLPKPKEESV
jgi:hypothetical protein